MGFLYFIMAAFWCVTWGVVTNIVIHNKGYDDNWFWWGFFFGFIAVIVACTKPQAVYYTSSVDSSMQKRQPQPGEWECAYCGTVNAHFYTTCTSCGLSKTEGIIKAQEEESKKAQEEDMKKARERKAQELTSAQAIKEFKDLLDTGIITQEEFEAKKKELLGL